MKIDIKNVRWLKQKQGTNSWHKFQSAALTYSIIKWDPIFLFIFIYTIFKVNYIRRK